jgi:hypothetical protein
MQAIDTTRYTMKKRRISPIAQVGKRQTYRKENFYLYRQFIACQTLLSNNYVLKKGSSTCKLRLLFATVNHFFCAISLALNQKEHNIAAALVNRQEGVRFVVSRN